MFKRTLTAAVLAAAIATGTATPALAETLQDRNNYINYVAPYTEVGPTLRVRLLGMGYYACEGIVANVPSVSVVTTLRSRYSLTSSEAWRIYVGADRHFC